MGGHPLVLKVGCINSTLFYPLRFKDWSFNSYFGDPVLFVYFGSHFYPWKKLNRFFDFFLLVYWGPQDKKNYNRRKLPKPFEIGGTGKILHSAGNFCLD